jgi:hypothetical protein
MRKDMLKRHFTNYAIKHGLKYIFVEGMIKQLPYQGIEYFPIFSGGLSFQREIESLPDDSPYKYDIFPLDFSFYMTPLIKTGNEKLIIPVIVHDLQEYKLNANPEYLCHFKERKYLPLIFDYYLKIKKLFPYRELFFGIINKEDVPLVRSYLKKVDWASSCDECIRGDYDPDCLKKLSKEEKEEYEQFYKERVEMERKSYENILNGIAGLSSNELERQQETLRNQFREEFEGLCGASDFSHYDNWLKKRQRNKEYEDVYAGKYNNEWERIEKLIPGVGEFIIGVCPLRISVEPLERKTTEKLKDILNRIEKTRKQWETSEVCAEQLKETVKEINGILAARELQAKKPNLFNIRLFALGLSSYVYEHEYSEPYPVDIFKLCSEDFVEDNEIFYFIPDLSKPRIRTKFLYRGGLKYQEGGKDYVLAYPQAENGKRAVMLTGGDVVEVPEEEFLKEAQKQGFPLK